MCHHSNRQSVSENTQQGGTISAVVQEDTTAAGHTLKLTLGFVTATLNFEGHVSLRES